MRTIADRRRGAARALSLAELSSLSTGLDRRASGSGEVPTSQTRKHHRVGASVPPAQETGRVSGWQPRGR